MPKQSDHHLERPLDAYGDQRVWTHAQLLQMAGQLVGALIELAIRQLPVFEHHRRGVRRPVDLLLKELMQAAVLGIGNLRPVPVHEQLLALSIRQKGQFRQPSVRISGCGLEHRSEVPDHAFDAGLVKKVGAVFDFQIDAVIAVGQHQREVELCGSTFGQHRFDLESLEPDKREQLIAIAPVEHHLEERRVTRASRGLDSAHHLVEGRRAMSIKIKTVFLHAKQQLSEAQVSV